MRLFIDRSVTDFFRGWFLAQKIVILPVPSGPHRARHETAATVRTYVVEEALDALSAKRAFE
jgi:hypothetical protein